VIGLPWQRFAREPLVLFLILLTTFSVVNPRNVQDVSRLALGVSVLTHGTLKIDRYVSQTAYDNASYGGHSYSDKAPGLSFLALPQTAVALAVDSLTGHHGGRVWNRMWELWPLRLFVNGLLLGLICLTLGRVAEGLTPRAGPVVAVVAGLGTLLGPLGTVLFEHDGAGLFAFASFCLAWNRRYVISGLAAGCAVLFAYEAAIAAALIGGYVLLRGLRPAAVFLAGAIPTAAVLAVYDTLAFGSPLHLSDRYVSPFFSSYQHRGLFGFSPPSLSDLRGVLTGGSGFAVSDGIVITMPVAIAAAVGLLLLWRSGARTEAALCIAVAAAFLVFDAGYWAPNGGDSPGPRFFATAIPFLLVGVAPALRRFPRTTLALAAVSIAVTTIDALTWDRNDGIHFRYLPDTVWAHVGLGQVGGVVVVALLAAAATALAFAPWLPALQALPGDRRTTRTSSRTPTSRGRAA
jgi:hypothetical protein